MDILSANLNSIFDVFCFVRMSVFLPHFAPPNSLHSLPMYPLLAPSLRPRPPLFLESNLHFPSNVDFSLHFNTRLHVCIWDSQVGLSQGGKQLGSEGIGILTWTDETIRNKNDAITLELLSVALSVKTPGLKTVWSQCIGASAVRKTDVRRKTRRPNRGQRPQGSRRRPHLHAG